MTNNKLSIAVAGSINLDIVATGDTLPGPGETVTGAVLTRYPGGKGANQALAAQRLGARVSLHGTVGRDAAADEALSLLKAGGVDLSGVLIDESAATGAALIAVSREGENQIIVAPGANAAFAPSDLRLAGVDAVICQLEIPVETVQKAAADANFFCLNAAPAKPLPKDLIGGADLFIVNETEAAFYGDALRDCSGLMAITYGAAGAALFKKGEEIARVTPPKVTVIDTTGAGDAFTAALTIALVENRAAEAALSFACMAGALATSKPGAQPSLPHLSDINALLR